MINISIEHTHHESKTLMPLFKHKTSPPFAHKSKYHVIYNIKNNDLLSIMKRKCDLWQIDKLILNDIKSTFNIGTHDFLKLKVKYLHKMNLHSSIFYLTTFFYHIYNFKKQNITQLTIWKDIVKKTYSILNFNNELKIV